MHGWVGFGRICAENVYNHRYFQLLIRWMTFSKGLPFRLTFTQYRLVLFRDENIYIYTRTLLGRRNLPVQLY